MLLMNKIAAQYPQQLGYCKSPNAIVTTQPASSWKAFFQQRIRWGQQGCAHMNSAVSLMVLMLVYFTNLLIFSFLLIGLLEQICMAAVPVPLHCKIFYGTFFCKGCGCLFQGSSNWYPGYCCCNRCILFIL